MKRTRISDQLTFLEPDDMRLFQACAGVMVQSTRKLVIDTNMGPETAAFLDTEQPQAAIISHYHLDHAVWTTVAHAYTSTEVFIPSGEDPHLTDIDFFRPHRRSLRSGRGMARLQCAGKRLPGTRGHHYL